MGGVDLVDQTPVLDIKPYVPYDCIPRGRVPSWVSHNVGATERGADHGFGSWNATEELPEQPGVRVEFSAEAAESLETLVTDPQAARSQLAAVKDPRARLILRAYEGRPKAFYDCVAQVVAQDPRSVHQGRGKHMTDTSHAITIDGLEIVYVAEVERTLVTHVHPVRPIMEESAAAPEHPDAIASPKTAGSEHPPAAIDTERGCDGEMAAAGCRELLEQW